MAMWVRFTDEDGKPVMINLDQCRQIQPFAQHIVFDRNTVVKGDFDELTLLLNAMTIKPS